MTAVLAFLADLAVAEGDRSEGARMRGFPLFQRGSEGDLATLACTAAAEIPPSPPLKKGGVKRLNARGAFQVALWITLLLFSFVASPAWAETPVPALQARVTDLTATLDANSKQALEAKLAALEQAKGAQIAVLIVAATAPESIEQYALRVAETWKLGRKGVDDGALLLIARDERALRIEVGYGLEGAIPDALAKRIIAEIIVPRFKAGDFVGGIDAGVAALIKLAEGEALPAPKQGVSADGLKGLGDSLPLAMMFIFVIGSVLRMIFGRLVGAGVAGAVAFLGAWLLLGGLLVGLAAALVAFVFVLVGGHVGGRGYGRHGGGYGGGGGFGGGGGGFGGGGASGRW
ncbi:MAG: YgcG family protein [Pseudomonadota bacterium]|nr:YgcG family protein [Pseudomonadota bacterium]